MTMVSVVFSGVVVKFAPVISGFVGGLFGMDK